MIEYHPLCLSEGNHRFALVQAGQRVLFVLGVNPSTADEDKPDPTMQSVLRFVNAFGYDGFVMLNLSSERATDPKKLSWTLDKGMHQKNLSIISTAGHLYPDADVLLAFGNFIERREYLVKCFSDIFKTLTGKRKWLCIGGMDGLTKYGNPRHPLYASVELGLGEFDLTKSYRYRSFLEYTDFWYKEDETRRANPDPEWRWCLVGNVVGSHPFGENGEERAGTKQFVPGAKVYCAPGQWGDGYEHIAVIGHPRRGKQLIEIVMPSKRIENFRIQKVFKPAVLEKMANGKYWWWGNSDQDYETLSILLQSIIKYRESH